MTTGIETGERQATGTSTQQTDTLVAIADQHQRLTQVTLMDMTDRNNQLVQTREWLLHNKDTESRSLTGNLFAVERTLKGTGKIFVKRAPLPHVRAPGEAPVDLTVRQREGGGFEYVLHQTGPEDLESWQVLDYEGGDMGRTRVLHQWQQSCRPRTKAHSEPRFLSNSWGDRNRDARIQHDFILREIDTGADLGVEVIQIDDGWQKGISANSSEAKERGGVWSNFWNTDPEFWTPNPDRFPHGLEPILRYAEKRGVAIGLWYAPDSWEEFANWRKDADQIVHLHRHYHVTHFKLDGISAETITARRNLKAMLEAVIEEPKGEIVCDLDITAGVRPGYFGALAIGPLFVENRYTDWHNYWPHFTLRNLWQLSQWIDPRRLRMELLNNARNACNACKYEGDPLAPSLYPPATLFAMTMFSNPLGWFENSGLSEAFIAEVAPLVTCWKAHREQIFAGGIVPIGQAPDGVAWTGFYSGTKMRGYVVVFNETNPDSSHRFELPESIANIELLSGTGSVHSDGRTLVATLNKPFGYLFARITFGGE